MACATAAPAVDLPSLFPEAAATMALGVTGVTKAETPVSGDGALASHIARGVEDSAVAYHGTTWGDNVRVELGGTYLTALGLPGRYATLHPAGSRSVRVAAVREADGRWTLIPDVLAQI